MDGFCGVVHKDSAHNLMHVPLEESVISVTIVDELVQRSVSARVTVTQVYRNESDTETSRCKYVFPVPTRAAVCAFSMIREDRHLIYGVVKEKSQAAEEYEAGIKGGKFSGLVHWVSDDVFTISLGSIPAKQIVTTRTMFIMDLMNDDLSDKVQFQLPRCLGHRYGPTPTGFSDNTTTNDRNKVKITTEIQTSGAILSVTSPSHEIQLERYNTHYGRPSRRRMITKFRSKTFLDRDFVLVVQADGLDTPRCFMEQDLVGDTVALQLSLIPKFDLPPITRQEYIFLIDRSRSMNSDDRIDVAKESLSMLIRCLPSQNTLFNVFSFGSSCSSLWQNSVLYDENRLQEAVQHIDGMDTEMGGTEIHGAIKSVFNSRNRTVPTAVFVLTDGEITSNEEGPAREVVAAASSSSLSNASIRLFILGIGLRTSTAACEGLARVGNGECLIARSTESILGKCTSLFRAGRTSTIKDISINWGVASTRDSGVQLNGPDVIQQSPAMIEHLYPHSRSVVFAILRTKKAPNKVIIRGTIDGGEVVELNVKVESVKFGKDSSSPLFLHSLAARRLIRDLEEDNSMGKLPEAVWKAAIIRLGERYQLVSAHTSFVTVGYGKAILPVSRDRQKLGPGVRSRRSDPVSSPIGMLRTVWSYISNPFAIFGSSGVDLMTQQNPSTPGSWPSTSESSSPQPEVDGDPDHESRHDSVSTFSSISSLESRSSLESERERRGRRSQVRPRQRQDHTQTERSPSPQVLPTREVGERRNVLHTSIPPPRRISSNVSRLVQLMTYEGSFPLNGFLTGIAGVDTLERVRSLHVDEKVCATALAIVFLEKNLADQRELLAALMDKVMEFIRGHSGNSGFHRTLIRARELIG